MKKTKRISSKTTVTSKKWRGALIYFALFGFAPLISEAAGAETVKYVSNDSELRAAISEYNNNTGADYRIVLKGNVALTSDLPTITGNADLEGAKSGSLTIDGAGYSINGGGSTRGLIIDTADAGASVSVVSTTFANCVAKGGDGGDGASGGGGGLGAGAAIYAKSGKISLSDVSATGNSAVGGNGGAVLQNSYSYGGGGGLGGDGGDGTLLKYGAANGGGISADGADATADSKTADDYRKAGDGGETSETNPESFGHYDGTTDPIGGNSEYGGGGGGSTGQGGDGGFGGGGGAGATTGGSGGFGGGGAGGSSEKTAGLGGFGAGNGGYVEGTTSQRFSDTDGGGAGGGGAALGGAIFVGEDADVTFVVSGGSTQGISGNSTTAGTSGGGTAEDGEAIGSGVFLLNDMKIEVAKGATYTIANGLGGVAGSKDSEADADGSYEEIGPAGGIVKTGEGTLVLNSTEAASYTGDTIVKAGTLAADSEGAISEYSALQVDGGTVGLGANQSVVDLKSGEDADGTAVVDLGGKTLTVSKGDAEGESRYNGIIKSNGTKGTGGVLVKEGTGKLTLAGDSRALLAGEERTKSNDFTTKIVGGTVRAESDGAFGDGTIVYSRTDANDQTAALELAKGVGIGNGVVFSGNTQALKVGGETSTLSGKFSVDATNKGTAALDVALNDATQTLTLTNTGVSKSIDSESGETVWSYKSTDANALDSVALTRGTLDVYSSSFADKDGTRYWYDALGNATLTNAGDNKLVWTLDADDANANVAFANKIVADSGTLAISAKGRNIEYGGSTSGAGGIKIDVGSGATFKLTGTFGQGATDLASGTLDVSGAKGSTVSLGKLSSSANDVALVAGEKTLNVGFDDGTATYAGTIVGAGTGAKIVKSGTGAWVADFANGSTVDSLAINGGSVEFGSTLGANPINFDVALGSNGTLTVGENSAAKTTLGALDASKGGAIQIAEGKTLALSSDNTSTKLAANLSGAGTLELANVESADWEGLGVADDWSISGNNSEFAGTISATDEGAKIALDSTNAVSAKSAIVLGDFATLTANKSNALGSLTLGKNGEVALANNSTLTVKKLIGSQKTRVSGKGGTLVLNGAGAATDYTGATTVSGATLKVVGDNRATGRGATTLTNGGTLYFDYSGTKASETGFESVWGSELKIDGFGTLTVANAASEATLNEAISFVGAGSDELTVDAETTSVVLKSAISGDGALKKIGNGVLTLDGTGAFKSATVGAGTLRLGTGATNAQLADAAVVVSGGSLIGSSDSFASLVLNSGSVRLSNTGKVALTDSGSAFALNGGTVYIGVKNANEYTDFAATNGGTVALNKGAFYVDAAKDAGLKSGDKLTVVSADAGKLTANVDQIKLYDNVAGTRFVVDESGIADGKFTLRAKTVDYASGATSINERSAGSYVNALVERGGLDASATDFIAAFEDEIDANPSSLNLLTGETRLSAVNAQLSSRNLIRQTLTQNVLPRASSTASSAYTGVRGQASEDEGGITGWTAAFGAGGSADDHRGASGFDYKLLGGIVGIELGSNPTEQFGLYYSYAHTGVDANSALGETKVGDNQFGAYLRWNDALGYGFATGSLGVSKYDTNRSLAFGGRNWSNFDGSADGWSGSVYLERGYTFELPASNIQPYGGLQYTHFNVDSFTESGALGAFALDVAEVDYNSLQGVLGTRWTKSTVLANRLFDFNAYMNWTHEFLDANAEGQASFVGGPNGTFRVVGNGVGRDWAYTGLGGTWTLSDRFDVFGGADVQLNQYTTYVNGSAGLKLKW